MGLLLSCCDPNREESAVSGDRARLVQDESCAPSVSAATNSETVVGSLTTSNFANGLTEGSMPPDCSIVSPMPSGFAAQRQKEEAKTLETVLDVISKEFVDMEGFQVQQQAAIAHVLNPNLAAEPVFVQDRVTDYGKRLQKAAQAVVLKHAEEQNSLSKMTDVNAKADLEKAMFGEVISDSDAMLINEVSARAQEALIEFKVELLDEVLVPIGPLPSQDLPR